MKDIFKNLRNLEREGGLQKKKKFFGKKKKKKKINL